MDWIKHLNVAMGQIEERLTREIEVETLAKTACCSAYHLQRMFGYLSGVTLGEYIRRRRMSLAAADLKAGAKVIDVALKYGYDSPTSFNRAFQSVHGVAPSEARLSGVTLKSYPPVSFKLTVKGVEEMEYRIEEKPAFRIVGVKKEIPFISDDFEASAEQAFRIVPEFWQQTSDAGLIAQIAGLMDQQPQALLGVNTCNEGKGESNYTRTTSKPSRF
jgi:AraC family transcriptional regulator